MPTFCRPIILLLAALLGATPALAARVDCDIRGIESKEMLKNVEVSLSMVRISTRKDLTPAEIDRAHRRAPAEIREALAPFGYYHVAVDDTLIMTSRDRFSARYVIGLGEPVRVRQVSVSVTGEGRDRPPFPKLVAEYPLKAGDVLDQRLYERRKSAFALAAADSGYLDAEFKTSTIVIDRDENIADITVSFDTGQRYLFGQVIFDSTVVDDRVLRSFLTFKRGDPFRYDQLLSFQSALGGATYFSRVEATPRRDVAVGREIPIQVKLEPRRPQRFETGVGYGTDTGARILFNMELRRLTRSGHRLNSRINVSQVELSLRAEYFMPSLYPQTHAHTVGAFIGRLDPDAYKTYRIVLGPTRSQKRGNWLESITLTYEREDYSVGADNGVTNLAIAGLTYRLKRADDDIYPTHGYRIDLGLRGSHQALLSSQSFLSPTLYAKGVKSVARGIRLIGRLDSGWVDSSMFRDLPPTIRFFAGGDNSIRGFDYQSLGPVDENGRVIGGRLLLVGSVEVQYPLPGKFAAAAFYDTGNAFEEFGTGIFEEGAGGGFRWRSPVGPIRIDLGFPLRYDGWKLHFTMGPDL